MKKIVLFNHKGGVSKTTTTFNLGWMFAEKGKKVLLVDADPQCNLTSMFLGDSFDEYYENVDTKGQNIKDGVKSAFEGRPEPIKPLTCKSAIRNGNLYLLAGHMNFSEYDAQLNFAQNASNALTSLKSLPGALNDLIEKTATHYNIDYVFIDLNPGLSSINQNLFLISDAFVIPTNPDTFSLMALKSLSRILPNWVKWKNHNMELYRDSAYPLPESTPKFAGEIAQRFNIRNGQATKPYKEKIEELTDLVIHTLAPSFASCNMIFPQIQYENAGIGTDYKLAEIKDFQGLSPKSHKAHVPVYALTDEELDAKGAALAGMQDNRQVFRDLYSYMSDKIIALING